MNLYSYAISAMKRTDIVEKRFLQFQTKLLQINQLIDELLEDPLFADAIHGNDEVGLDQTKEFIENIISHFEDPGNGNMTVDEILAGRLPDET